MEALGPFATVFALAFLCESLTEYFFADLLASLRLEARYLRYIAALVGVTLSLLYGLDALRDLLGISPRFPYAGELLTGLLLGRGANYLHDFYTTYATQGGRG